jgi:GNAT superfamily N-acetyltransferase
MRINPNERTEQQAALPRPESLEAAARLAFASHVRLYDEQDQIIVHAEPHELRLVYLSVRASRQASAATFIQCRVDGECEQMWITSLQVSDALQRQGLGREMVEAAEATAKAMGFSSIKIYPLMDAVGFWKSLGYTPDAHISRVLEKGLR